MSYNIKGNIKALACPRRVLVPLILLLIYSSEDIRAQVVVGYELGYAENREISHSIGFGYSISEVMLLASIGHRRSAQPVPPYSDIVIPYDIPDSPHYSFRDGNEKWLSLRAAWMIFRRESLEFGLAAQIGVAHQPRIGLRKVVPFSETFVTDLRVKDAVYTLVGVDIVVRKNPLILTAGFANRSGPRVGILYVF